MKLTNKQCKQLYESIISKISKDVKKIINESYTSRSQFYDDTYEFYEEWLDHKGVDTINRLERQGKISTAMDEMDVTDIVLEEFNKLLDNAVGGDWEETGIAAGYTDEELNDIYVDDMQAKVDCITDYMY
jgi:hypothetical protein